MRYREFLRIQPIPVNSGQPCNYGQFPQLHPPFPMCCFASKVLHLPTKITVRGGSAGSWTYLWTRGLYPGALSHQRLSLGLGGIIPFAFCSFFTSGLVSACCWLCVCACVNKVFGILEMHLRVLAGPPVVIALYMY